MTTLRNIYFLADPHPEGITGRDEVCSRKKRLLSKISEELGNPYPYCTNGMSEHVTALVDVVRTYGNVSKMRMDDNDPNFLADRHSTCMGALSIIEKLLATNAALGCEPPVVRGLCEIAASPDKFHGEICKKALEAVDTITSTGPDQILAHDVKVMLNEIILQDMDPENLHMKTSRQVLASNILEKAGLSADPRIAVAPALDRLLGIVEATRNTNIDEAAKALIKIGAIARYAQKVPPDVMPRVACFLFPETIDNPLTTAALGALETLVQTGAGDLRAEARTIKCLKQFQEFHSVNENTNKGVRILRRLTGERNISSSTYPRGQPSP